MQKELHRIRIRAVWRGGFSPPQVFKCTVENVKNAPVSSAVIN
jgi:hypothetical protein